MIAGEGRGIFGKWVFVGIVENFGMTMASGFWASKGGFGN